MKQIRNFSIIAHIDHGKSTLSDRLIQLAKFNISAPLYYHSNEQPIAANIETLSNLYGLSGLYHNAPKATKWIDSMPSLHFGTIMFSILETPGHSPGHICLFTTPTQTHLTGQFSEPCHPNQPILIGGDTLFQGSIGRTDLPLANHDQLITSIHSKLLTLPDDTIVLSGHGPNTTIGQEKQTNPFLI